MLGAFGVVLVLIVLTFFITKPSPSPTKSNTSVQAVKLSDYAGTNAEVSYTIEGITNHDSLHRTIKITVNNHLVNLTIFSGYQGNVLKAENLTNNENAYRSFLAGLQTLGYLNQRRTTAELLGSCPLGNKFIFANSNIPKAPSMLWTTSCGIKNGSFAGNLSGVQQLFRLQVPNYSQFTSGVSLN